MSSTPSGFESGNSLQPLVALFGKVRRNLLTILFCRAEEDFYVRELARMVEGGQGGVQRELLRLLQAGLIERRRRGRQLFYRANKASPYFKSLRELFAPKEKLRKQVKKEPEGKQLETEARSWLQRQKPYLG